jgi:CRP-like cAMP-binding protein
VIGVKKIPKNQLLASLPKGERARLSAHLEPVTVELHQTLVEFDQPIKFVWFLDDCVTSTVVNSQDNSSVEVGLMGAEGMVGLSLLFGVERSNSTVIVQIPGRATRMRAGAFVKEVVKKGGPLMRLLQLYTNYFMAMVAQHAACNALHTVQERMCRWILLTHDRVRRDQFQLTQEYLAQMLGVRRPSLSAVAGELKRAGLINYSRGTVTVLDRKGLEARSCPCYKIIRGQFTQILGKRLRDGSGKAAAKR